MANHQPTREDYRRRTCPTCGALPGEPCWQDSRYKPGERCERLHHHIERRHGRRSVLDLVEALEQSLARANESSGQ